jgi:hypothetical protein
MSESRNVTNVRPAPPRSSLTLDLPTLIATAVEKGLDPATIQMFLTLYNEQQDRQNKEGLNHQMADAAGEIAPVLNDAVNKHLGSRYTTHGAYMDMLRPILQPRGIRVGFEAGVLPGEPPVPDGHIRVRIVIGYGGYAERGSYIDEPVSRTGSQGGRTQMTEQQAIGSALTYAQRNLLKLTFNLTAAADEDDDGEASRETNGKPGNSKAQDDATVALRGWRGKNVAHWAETLCQRLAAAQSLEGIDALMNTPPVSEWLADQAGGPTKEERTKISVARMDATKSIINATSDDKTAAGKMMDNYDRGEAQRKADQAEQTSEPAQPSASLQALLARVASCQTKIALDSLMTAEEFSRPVSALAIAEGDQVTAAIKQRYTEVRNA